MKKIIQKWSIAFKIFPILLVITVLKYLAHNYNFEVMELNALFTSLVAGTIFLIGFLTNGVLSDYKESEKIPSEIAASLRTIFDDTYTISNIKSSKTIDELQTYQKELLKKIKKWLFKEEKTKSLLQEISNLNSYIIALDKEGIQVNYIIKLKNEQINLRKQILRIDTIRDTNFVSSAYTIVEAMGFLTTFGLLIIKIEPFYVSIFLTVLIAFLISYMIFLIKDLDNPFDYSTKGESGQEISLKPIHDWELELNEIYFPTNEK